MKSIRVKVILLASFHVTQSMIHMQFVYSHNSINFQDILSIIPFPSCEAAGNHAKVVTLDVDSITSAYKYNTGT